jgi:hypothetical protein
MSPLPLIVIILAVLLIIVGIKGTYPALKKGLKAV